ncbi:thermonuclease family protein [Methylocystis heyeri]|uniref:thermonuclease family protein n=1 Tax=Methylocystis heyeri TaxID=391905 RepID=UPI00113EB3BB|nr:thermonuclease family protein [Methylocystis heyeri]
MTRTQNDSAFLAESTLARALFLAAISVPAQAQGVDAARESGPCSLAGVSPAVVALVDDDFDLLLDDGRRVVLAGLEFPAQGGKDPGLRARALSRLSALLEGDQVFLSELSPAPDRWGRHPAYAAAPDRALAGAPLALVGAAMLQEGLARFRPDPAAADCAKLYQAAEAPAREKNLGIWTSEPVVDFGAAGNSPSMAGLAERKGMVVVSGVVQSVGESRRAAYLNLGRRGVSKFAVMISRRNFAIFEAGGVGPLALKGRRLRARGLIETHNGLLMEIASPAELELLDGDAAP